MVPSLLIVLFQVKTHSFDYTDLGGACLTRLSEVTSLDYTSITTSEKKKTQNLKQHHVHSCVLNM